ncbi:MAG: NAD(P)H-dependent oxidoreductase [Planctomycetota bacterium]|nr:MAG: NAD(P)H-dependent oxidoreductase [Planctomycetota bacterium]
MNAPTHSSTAVPALEPARLTAALEWRYAVKKFDTARSIPAVTWQALEHALVHAPSSYGLQPWRFVVVSDPALRAKLREVSWKQPQVTDASHFVVFAARVGVGDADVRRYAEHIAAVRGVSLESLAGFQGMMSKAIAGMGERADAWTARQTYIALGTLLTSAAVLGIDACPMEGLDGPRYDELLGLAPLGYRALCAAALGYRAADDANAALRKVRFPSGEVILRR